MKQQINYDIAWQTFDEVNKFFDVDKFVDLNCLDLIDAQAILKQKIYDVAMLLQESTPMGQEKNWDGNRVLIVQCGDNHLVQTKVD